jgi:exonuclease SbcC
LYVSNGAFVERVENIKKQQIELQSLRDDYEAYDLFIRCMHPNGISYDIIKNKLPAINEEISKILANVVDFEVFFEEDGNRLNIYIKHYKYDPRPIEMGSGAEKSVAAIAIRLALLNVSNLPKSNIFVLDEPATALDEENMDGFVRILDMVKSSFKTVLLISHLDSLKDCTDTQLIIDKKDKYAYINC